MITFWSVSFLWKSRIPMNMRLLGPPLGEARNKNQYKNGREIKVSKTMWFPSLENINDPIPLFRRLRHEEVSALFKAKIFSFLLGTRQRGLLVTAVPKSEPPSWTSWSGDKEIYFLSMIFLLYLQHRYVRLSSLHRRRSDLPCKVLCTARPGRRSVYLHLAAHWQSRSTLHLLL